jgi:hypothetical protein
MLFKIITKKTFIVRCTQRERGSKTKTGTTENRTYRQAQTCKLDTNTNRRTHRDRKAQIHRQKNRGT